MPIVVSTRAVISGAKLLKSGMSVDNACEKLIWRGLPKSDIEKITGSIESKYISALSQYTR